MSIDAATFERQYAERSGIALAEVRKWRKVVPCGADTHGCDDPECEGWGMVSPAGDICGECGHYDFKHPVSGCAEFTRERRWPR